MSGSVDKKKCERREGLEDVCDMQKGEIVTNRYGAESMCRYVYRV